MLSALEHGADLFKFFTAEIVSVQSLDAIRVELPVDARCAVVGGITPEKMANYLVVCVSVFVLRSVLFKPVYSLDEFHKRIEY